MAKSHFIKSEPDDSHRCYKFDLKGGVTVQRRNLEASTTNQCSELESLLNSTLDLFESFGSLKHRVIVSDST